MFMWADCLFESLFFVGPSFLASLFLLFLFLFLNRISDPSWIWVRANAWCAGIARQENIMEWWLVTVGGEWQPLLINSFQVAKASSVAQSAVSRPTTVASSRTATLTRTRGMPAGSVASSAALTSAWSRTVLLCVPRDYNRISLQQSDQIVTLLASRRTHDARRSRERTHPFPHRILTPG